MTDAEAIQQARDYVLENEGDLFQMVPHQQHPDRFVFYFLLRKFLETGDRKYQLVGPGPVVLNKADGRFFRYSSAYTPEQADANYVAAMLRERITRQLFPDFDVRNHYSMTVSGVARLWPLIDLLESQRLTYILPEVRGKQVIREPKQYSRELLHARLEDLPATFSRVAGSAVARLVQVHMEQPLANISLHPPAQRSSADSSEVHLPEW